MKTNLTITTFRCYKLSSAARLSAEIKVLHKEQNFTFKTVKLAFIITIWLFSEFPTNLLNKWGKELRLKAVKSSLRKTSKTLCIPPASSGLKSRPTPFSAIPFITEATKRRKNYQIFE